MLLARRTDGQVIGDRSDADGAGDRSHLVGVLLLHAGLFILLPWTVEAKAVLGMFLGLAYVVIGGVALHVAMDEKTWMEKSGAAEMLEEAIGRSNKDSPDGKGST